jgi:hypothetical protein
MRHDKTWGTDSDCCCSPLLLSPSPAFAADNRSKTPLLSAPASCLSTLPWQHCSREAATFRSS